VVFKATKNRLSFGVELYLYMDLFPDLFTVNMRTGFLELDVIAIFSFVASPLLSVFVLYTLLSCPLLAPAFCYYIEQKQKKVYSQISVPAVGLLSMTSRGKLPRILQDVRVFAATTN